METWLVLSILWTLISCKIWPLKLVFLSTLIATWMTVLFPFSGFLVPFSQITVQVVNCVLNQNYKIIHFISKNVKATRNHVWRSSVGNHITRAKRKFSFNFFFTEFIRIFNTKHLLSKKNDILKWTFIAKESHIPQTNSKLLLKNKKVEPYWFNSTEKFTLTLM